MIDLKLTDKYSYTNIILFVAIIVFGLISFNSSYNKISEIEKDSFSISKSISESPIIAEEKFQLKRISVREIPKGWKHLDVCKIRSSISYPKPVFDVIIKSLTTDLKVNLSSIIHKPLIYPEETDEEHILS